MARKSSVISDPSVAKVIITMPDGTVHTDPSKVKIPRTPKTERFFHLLEIFEPPEPPEKK